MPRPLFNHAIAGMEVDVVWPELRMVVELDSQRFHGDWQAAARDRDRDQRLALAGWICHRFVRRVVSRTLGRGRSPAAARGGAARFRDELSPLHLRPTGDPGGALR